MSGFLKIHQSKSRIITLMVLAVWLDIFTGEQAFAGQGYLKAVGPTPLRFDSPNTNTLMSLKTVMQVPKLSAVATNVATSNKVMEATSSSVANTNMEIANVPSVTNPAPDFEVVTNQAVIGGVNNNSDDGSSSARDLLPVATSMITEYLKSTQSQTTTNRADRPGATVFVPLQMGFTPPVVQGAGAVPESRAAYKSQ